MDAGSCPSGPGRARICGMTSDDAARPDHSHGQAGPPADQPASLPADGSASPPVEPPTKPQAQPPAGPPVARPERRPWNTSGYIGFALAAVAFASSVLIAWPGAIFVAALALALSITGAVRLYRGRATNHAAVYTALALAVTTIILGFVWSNRAQPCARFVNDQDRFTACYNERTGLL